MVVMGTFLFRIERISFSLWYSNSLVFFSTVDTCKSSKIYPDGRASSCFSRAIFLDSLGTHPEATWCQAICFVHFTHRLQIPCPQPTFIIVKNQTNRWPATNSFPNKGTTFLQFPEIHLWKKKECFWLKRLIGCQTKLGQRDILYKSGSLSEASASFCFISKAIHELKTRAAEAFYMFMKAQGCLWS